MKIILSPSKTQNNVIFNKDNTKTILFPDLTIKLFNYFQSLSKAKLQETLKIKGKLLEDTYKLYQAFNPKNQTIKAIDCYKGVAYEQIDTNRYNKNQVSYLNNNLIILSAMYGILKPNTSIWPYRLDMTIKPNNINLYKYWKENIDNFFKETNYTINLASNEFSKMINNEKLINIHFLEKRNNKLKSISYNAKKARGKMVHEMVLNQINNLDQLKKITVDDYVFEKNMSNEKDLYFIKQE
ncbi:MAG: YaaA family protein [Bacillota bacterium]